MMVKSDLNNFYASVECLLDSSLEGFPVVVCGRVEDRHGIVLAKNSGIFYLQMLFIDINVILNRGRSSGPSCIIDILIPSIGIKTDIPSHINRGNIISSINSNWG